ncbi:hypothetical protein FH972_021089 [Carpinus fangiana]|uniref:AB hydrolase-1 domain-containing protein n=1 Tax=Carpinus fangiana TaxID=176857 RepID=A0A5N6KNY0_9ROSI|nr:hypothetical protein FH972_021089 [Carpinus fangiana]
MAKTSYFHYDLQLSSYSEPAGTVLKAKLAYRAFGDKSLPAVLLPTCFGGRVDTELPFLYSEDAAAPFPTSKYYVIVCGLLGGSESSSPSNQDAPHAGLNFPRTTFVDNIRLQKALCSHLGVRKLFAYVGFSMGGCQAYTMASAYPEFVERAIVICGSARTSWHNYSFLEGPKAALVNSVDFHGGRYETPPRRGIGAFGRVYSTWALSQEWFRQKCWEQVGCDSLDAYLESNWERAFDDWDANDLLCLLWTWQKGDITKLYPEDNGDLARTLARIKAKVLLLPGTTDAYFPPEDNEAEVLSLGEGKLVAIPSIWGHLAGGGGGTLEDARFIQDQISQFIGVAPREFESLSLS